MDGIKPPPSIKPKKLSKTNHLVNAFSNTFDTLSPTKKKICELWVVCWYFNSKVTWQPLSNGPYYQ